MEAEDKVLQETTTEVPSPVNQPLAYARQTRADRLRQAAIEPDFVQQKVRGIDEILGDSVLQLSPEEIDEIVRTSGVKGSLGEQAAVAVQNALMSYNSLTEYNTMAGGNTVNYFTGNNIGDEWRDMGFEAIRNREELMNINEESVGGVRNWFAKLAGGATSMGQMALEGFATAGYLPLVKMGLLAYGEGTYNDLKKYADEHDGSLKGYEPKGVDLAVNTANGFVQAYIERKFGVASPRFLTGWSRGFWKEGFSGILQEFAQSEASDLAEYAKGNEDVSYLLDNALENLIDATVAFPLQGALGSITNQQQRKRADALVARARAISKGRKDPLKEDFDAAKKINDAKEQGLASALTTEFKAAFEASSGEGKLQKKIANAINDAVKKQELDLDTANETELAQKIEGIATQQTLTALEDALEKGKSVSDLELNKITYKDGAIWLEGTEPQLGDKTVSQEKVLRERQKPVKIESIEETYMATPEEREEVRTKTDEVVTALQEEGIEVTPKTTKTGKVYSSSHGSSYIDVIDDEGNTFRVRIGKNQIGFGHGDRIDTNINLRSATKDIVNEIKDRRKARRRSQREMNVNKGFDKAPTTFEYQTKPSGKGIRSKYNDALKQIILTEKSDVSSLQHEFAHYWMQNNFKWARSGMASQDWLKRWRAVEDWLDIRPGDRFLSKAASERFAKAYEHYVLEGKIAPELQWAFEGFQKAYQDIYEDFEQEYFDEAEELAPEVVDWFNRNKEQTPKRQLEADEKKVEKALTLAAGVPVMEDVAGTVVMTEQNKEGDPVVYMGVKESEIPAGDNLLVQADKTTASKLQQSAKKWLSDKVEVQQLTTLDTQATLDNFKNWIARDRAGAWEAMMNPDTRPIYRTYLYKAFAQEAMNDADLAVELANIDMGQAVREMGQAIQALDIRNESGFDTLEIMRNIEKSKGKISTEELNKEVESIGLDMIELSQADIDEIEFDTECKL
jgi:hypothetical protein